MVSPSSRRAAVEAVQQAHDLAERRSCHALGFARSSQRYQPITDDAGLRQRLRELAAERRRFGYRRLHILLSREGWAINRKKLYRLYREEGLWERTRRS